MSENISTSFSSLELAKHTVGVNFQLPYIPQDLLKMEMPERTTIKGILTLAQHSSHVVDKDITSKHTMFAFKPRNLAKTRVFVLIIKRRRKEYIVLVVGMRPGVFQITPESISEHIPANFINPALFSS